MKKKRWILLIIPIVLIYISLFACAEEDDSPYPKGGRDTVDEFGIRKFVILRCGDGRKILYKRGAEETIERKIYTVSYTHLDV